MIFTPYEHPSQTLALIVIIVLAGIIGGLLVHKVFMVIALIFWMLYTLVLALLQVIRKSFHDFASVTSALLNPFVRFVLFETVSIVGIIAVLRYNNMFIGTLALVAWLMFAVNFYIFYAYITVRHEERIQ
ncbi:hypothetical protein KY363_04750 [Candidatus Woesearchaeota archaeon]|nr:hypothetical protein [Candidatus Woesearchaeota archaeon]